MVSAAALNVVGGIGNRVNKVRNRWSEEERARRAAKAQRRTMELAQLLGLVSDEDAVDDEPVILAVGAPCCEDLLRMAK